MTPALRPVPSLQCLPAAGSRLCPVRSSSGGHFSYTGNETRAWASLHQLGAMVSGPRCEQIRMGCGPAEGARPRSLAVSSPGLTLLLLCCVSRHLPRDPWASSSPVCKRQHRAW